MASSEQTCEQTISNVETEYYEINSKGGWSSLFQHIRIECGKYEYTCNEARKPQNKSLNRYRDVVPFDHTRVILKRGVCDYIHANLIKVERANRQYILTQGPLSNTSGHFWLMVWEQNSKAVLMLNKIIEKYQIKCHQYWPLDDSKPIMTFEDVNLKVEYVSKRESPDYTTRTLRITDLETQDSREILHFHYTTWPDFGVPKSPTTFLRFLADVRQSGALDQNVGPPIVHCSAGIGRSGTLCLVDSCLVLIEKNGLNAVNVREVLLEMRKSRMGLIQSPEQLRFSYAAIIDGAKQSPLGNSNTENNEILKNYYEEMNKNNSSLEKDEKDDDPPPLPPRVTSLSHKTSDVSSDDISSDDESSTPPDKPLPSEPNHAEWITGKKIIFIKVNKCSNEQSSKDDSKHEETSSNDIDNSLQTNNSPSKSDAKGEVRRRNREKNERLAAQVREMKRRQKETEEWQKLKRSKKRKYVKRRICGRGRRVHTSSFTMIDRKNERFL